MTARTDARTAFSENNAIQVVLDQLDMVQEATNGFKARCPVHEDKEPSLSIWLGTKGENDVALKCWAGCDWGAIWRAVKLYPGKPTLREVLAYDYVDEKGVLRYQSVRYEPKDFRPWRMQGRGWRPGMKDVRHVLYRLPEVLVAPANAIVFKVEGEKDADRVRTLGLVATTNQGGAKAWKPEYEYAAALKGRDVVVLPDSDEAGIKHAIDVCRDVIGVARKVRVLELPVKDVSVWLDEGGTKAKLLELVLAAPDAATWLSTHDAPPERGDEASGKKTQATALVEIGRRGDLFHDSEQDAFVTITVGQHRETYPIRSRAFRRHLTNEFYRAYNKPPASTATEDALKFLEARAGSEGVMRPVPVRVALHDGTIWIDLGGPDWDAVNITRDGWTVVKSPAIPVRFRRGNDMAALPYPVAGGSLNELRPFVNCIEGHWPLVLGFVLCSFCPHPTMTYPVLVVTGERGSAKTTDTRVVKRLIDPTTELLRTEPREVRDLLISATNSRLLALDNVSSLPPWLSDAICRLSTGAGFSTRKLWADNEEIIFSARRPVVLNGIGEIATRSDLLDRSFLISLPTIDEEHRKTEDEFWTEFDAAHPRILGALFDALAMALRRYPDTRPDRLPRMADAARWVAAAESALPFPPGAFVTALRQSRETASSVALDAEPIVVALREVLAVRVEFTGTASMLLAAINATTDEQAKRQRGWPRTATNLSSRLRRIAPALRDESWTVEFLDEQGGRRTREMHLTAPGNPPTGKAAPF